MTGIVREVTIGPCRLIQGDCLAVLPLLSGVDAIITDPPYGIGADAGQQSRADKQHGKAVAPSKNYGFTAWDDRPCSAEQIAAMRSVSEWQVIFGGNYFALPPSRCWLIWDKLNGDNDYADCELAWTNLDKAVRRIQHLWHGMIRKDREERFHPTQKPVGVMTWCIGHLPEDAETILDPFMGSGTTGVAAIKTGKQFIGVEREPKYFDIAVSRIRRAWQDKCSEIKFEEPEPLKQLELV